MDRFLEHINNTDYSPLWFCPCTRRV